MIETLEELMEHSPASGPRLALGAGQREYFLVGADASEPREVSAELVDRLKRLGILYMYAGMLAFNAMALRLLCDMREGGAPLDEEGFRFRVEESKRLYRYDHLEDWPEPELDLPE